MSENPVMAFMNLPQNARLIVYRYLLVRYTNRWNVSYLQANLSQPSLKSSERQEIIDIFDEQYLDILPPAYSFELYELHRNILFVSRDIYKEAVRIFYGENHFSDYIDGTRKLGLFTGYWRYYPIIPRKFVQFITNFKFEIAISGDDNDPSVEAQNNGYKMTELNVARVCKALSTVPTINELHIQLRNCYTGGPLRLMIDHPDLPEEIYYHGQTVLRSFLRLRGVRNVVILGCASPAYVAELKEVMQSSSGSFPHITGPRFQEVEDQVGTNREFFDGEADE